MQQKTGHRGSISSEAQIPIHRLQQKSDQRNIGRTTEEWNCRIKRNSASTTSVCLKSWMLSIRRTTKRFITRQTRTSQRDYFNHRKASQHQWSTSKSSEYIKSLWKASLTDGHHQVAPRSSRYTERQLTDQTALDNETHRNKKLQIWP